jgi:hypothetical protein
MRAHVRRATGVGVVGALACVAVLVAASPQGPALASGLPPLIDRELFLGDPEIVAARISPDGRFIAFLKPFKGTRNIWVKRIDERAVVRAVTSPPQMNGATMTLELK